MEPQDFCDAPLIMKLAIQDIQPYSVLVSWQSREHSGLSGYQVIYHSLEVPDEVSLMGDLMLHRVKALKVLGSLFEKQKEKRKTLSFEFLFIISSKL